MRTLPVALALTLALPACTDALGLGAGCQSQMASVRFQYGNPSETEEGLESQIWLYDARPGRQRFTYEFDWSSGECRTSGPNPFSRAPVEQLPRP